MQHDAFQGDLDQYFNMDHALCDFRWPLFSRSLDYYPEIKEKIEKKELAMEAGFVGVSND